jgi:hypothetical protein
VLPMQNQAIVVLDCRNWDVVKVLSYRLESVYKDGAVANDHDQDTDHDGGAISKDHEVVGDDQPPSLRKAALLQVDCVNNLLGSPYQVGNDLVGIPYHHGLKCFLLVVVLIPVRPCTLRAVVKVQSIRHHQHQRDLDVNEEGVHAVLHFDLAVELGVQGCDSDAKPKEYGPENILKESLFYRNGHKGIAILIPDMAEV